MLLPRRPSRRPHAAAPRRVGLAVLLLALAALLGHTCAGLFAPDAPGPWPVGRVTFQVVDADRDGRTLPVDVWYPAVDDGTAPPSAYDLVFAQIVSDVALDAPPVAPQPFPMLVFSHGNDGIRFQSYFLCEQLASHGFVVVAPDHVGNTAADALLPNPPPFEVRDRLLDVSLAIDAMLGRAGDPADAFHGRVDPFRIGVLGHSFGGFTTLALASGFADVPADPRVSAILPISPATGLLDDAALASVELPILVLGGTSDTIVPVDPNNARAFEETSGRPRWRVDIEQAGHNSFTNICDIADALAGAGLPPALLDILFANVDQGCGPDLIPVEEAQRITNLYVVSFFQEELARRPGFRRYLTRGHVRREGLPVDLSQRLGLGRPH